jgi:hypothetical protein
MSSELSPTTKPATTLDSDETAPESFLLSRVWSAMERSSGELQWRNYRQSISSITLQPSRAFGGRGLQRLPQSGRLKTLLPRKKRRFRRLVSFRKCLATARGISAHGTRIANHWALPTSRNMVGSTTHVTLLARACLWQTGIMGLTSVHSTVHCYPHPSRRYLIKGHSSVESPSQLERGQSTLPSTFILNKKEQSSTPAPVEQMDPNV